MKNYKLVAWGIVGSISVAFIEAILEVNDNLYTLAGLGYMVFGIWAAIILFNLKK